MFTLYVAERGEAGGKGTVLQFVVTEFSDQYSACATVAFIAAGFGTAELLMIPDEIQ
jgi:hypothetical protein